jgi:hypothetical protein
MELTTMRKSEREIRKLARRVCRRWAVEPTRNGHLCLTHPDVHGQVIAASTASDHRALKNLQAMLRRSLERGHALSK